MISIGSEHLAGKVVLEVGSGRGDTTRRLVDLLSGQPESRLLVSDISDQFFPHLRGELDAKGVPIQFICTGAQELRGVLDVSVDIIVCNYTLCAVNAQAGLAALALRRFWEVLKEGGKLFVEEEFPLNKAETPAQQIWAEKWRILKAAMILAGRLPYNEIEPHTLASLCRLAGFQDVRWTAHTEVFHGDHVLDFFQQRLDALLAHIPDARLREGFAGLSERLHAKAHQVGEMEVPFYRLTGERRAG